MAGSVMENITDPPLPAPKQHTQSAPLLQPITTNTKAGVPVTLYPITMGPSSIPEGIVAYLHEEFTAEILKGCTYPMEEPMALDRFRDYWFGTFAVVVLKGTREETDPLLLLNGEGEEVDWKEVCLGTFYIKPNYPGMSCLPDEEDLKGGDDVFADLISCSAARGKGIGSVMGETYLVYAPKLGYKYSVFNLVFANNPASSRIWDRLGFQVLGRVPGAGRLANSEELVDALIYGRSLV
uniref:L-azetidine-2-carboxylic acid acetyltransferase n=1 Tax=Talaromyces marneffei PM1 TaxID=1077442 RepID=A0A093W3E9_TALMA